MVVEARLYESGPSRECVCNVCLRRCTIAEGTRGFCLTRENRAGTLYSLTYGRPVTIAAAVAERKPLFHFMPGKTFLSLGCLGCNFRCPGCQNWDIAHSRLTEEDMAQTEALPPERLTEMAKERGCVGISFTYNEPTVWFEYTLDASRIAKGEGLLTNYVTNGSMTPEALDMIGPFLDAFRVDVKGYWPSTYRHVANFSRPAEIREVAERAKNKWGMHVECVTNVIPRLNSAESELRLLARWIAEKLGKETPWHVTRFVPRLDLASFPPTPTAMLERAREIGMEEGLDYVYVGNIPGHPGEKTYCPDCGKVVIDRMGSATPRVRLEEGRCVFCGRAIEGRFEG